MRWAARWRIATDEARHPVPHPQFEQGPGRARHPGAGRPRALQGGDPPPAGKPAEPHAVPAGGRRPDGRGRPRGRRRDAGRHPLPRAHGGADGRHLPGRPDPCRPRQLPGRPRGRPAGGLAVGAAEGTEAAAGPAEDRHAAAARRPQHRLLASAPSSRATACRVAQDRCRCSASWAAPTCIRSRCRAGSRTPTSARTTSSAPASTAARCSPARSKASGRATARASKTRSTALPTRTATRSSWSPKA